MANKAIDAIRNLDKRKLAGMIAAILLIIVSTVFAFVYLTRPQYALLYSDLSFTDSASIVAILEAQNRPYQVEDSGRRIMVAREHVGPIRVIMAAEGLPSEASVGYELFDRDEGFGTSSFVQEVNRLRALEGELARTISSIDAISSARVHLVLPKRELFSRESRTPSASIILKLTRGQQLDGKQVRAIQNIVATAVPELEVAQVSIVDSKGTLLARGGEEGNSFYGSTPEEIKTGYETRLATQIETLVANIVGFGNVRVEVSAEIDFSQTVINEESFDPEGQVLRSSEEITENSARREGGPQPVTVETNLPEEDVANDNNQPEITENSARTETRRNYDISTRRVNRVVSPGQIRRLSVAVLVDGIYTEGEEEEGETAYAPRSDDELAEIERLVKSAIGYDSETREDKVDIVNLQFVEDDLLAESTDSLIFGIPAEEFRQLVELVVLSLVALVIFMVVIRPLLARNISAESMTLEQSRRAEAHRQELIAQGVPPGKAAVMAAAAVSDNAAEIRSAGEEILSGSGSYASTRVGTENVTVQRQLLSDLNEVVEKNPQESINAIRTWLAE